MSKKAKIKRAAKAEHAATRKVARHRDTPIVAALGRIGDVGDQPPLIAISGATIAMGALLRRPALARTGARMLASHLIATGMKTVLKSGIDRTRPARAIETGAHRVKKGSGSKDTGLNAFPSGHTAGAVAVAQAVARDTPALALPMRAAAAGIGAIQLPQGKHYASDVIVGAAIGWLSERIARVALEATERAVRRALARSPDPLDEAAAHPS